MGFYPSNTVRVALQVFDVAVKQLFCLVCLNDNMRHTLKQSANQPKMRHIFYALCMRHTFKS